MPYKVIKVTSNIAPLIINGGTEWKRGVSLTLSPLNSGLRTPVPIEDWVCPRAGVKVWRQEK